MDLPEAGVYILVFDPPPPGGGGEGEKYGNMLGEKIIERGWKKGGKCIFLFFLIG